MGDSRHARVEQPDVSLGDGDCWRAEQIGGAFAYFALGFTHRVFVR